MRNVSVIIVVLLLLFASSARASTLEDVQKQGVVLCGVSTGLPGFSNPDDKGNWTGLDVDICRAVAAAVLGDKNKVKFIPLTAKERFTALQTGKIDILSRDTAWTLTSDTSLALKFVGVSFYDGQGFMVSKKFGAKSAGELNGASICIQADATAARQNLAAWFKEKKMTYKPVLFDTFGQAVKGFAEGHCDVLTGGRSRLYSRRLTLANPDSAVVLPEMISKEPLGPMVRQGDDGWFNIVRWSLFAMIDAEELGVTSKNVDEMKKSADPAVLRLLGEEGIKGKGLGLADNWAYRIIKQVGNYGEIYARNVGRDSPLKIARGLNALWDRGGIQYAPPMR